MTKELYQILEINETASAEEIKKAYRKLAIKWHPDKWMNENLEERQNANDKMQKINKAYEILGDEEKKRRYDLGQVEFTTTDDFDLKEWIRRENERINEEIGEVDDRLEKIKKLLKELAREEVAGNIRSEMLLNGVSRKRLDSSLWSPYSSMEEKVWSIEIGDDENDREGLDKRKLNEFKEKMIKAIQEKKTQLTAEKVAKANSDLERTKIKSIGAIEKALQDKGLEIKDLETEYHNYEAEINSLTKIWKIRSWEDKVIEAIRRKSQGSLGGFGSKKADFNWQARPEKVEPIQTSYSQEPQITDKKEPLKNKYDNWTKEDLIKRIEELEAEIKQLKSEKVEKDEMPEFQIILEKKEMELKEGKEKFLQINGSDEKKLEPRQKNKFLTNSVVAGGIGVFVVLGFLVILITVNRNRRKKLRN